ncbi:MAG: disulfide bond formation protein B [Candidatus Liberibacter ctenarytainae]|uniref:Disulfide bond formation protein B n=1 Tax=Candidatus Liberibacter ctenarytainae TaxID=2020335 RepID=A0A937DGM4_9HYPH|nr:disulfide bond formation protein B [Candidatus Liberibacter ctenarytainae]
MISFLLSKLVNLRITQILIICIAMAIITALIVQHLGGFSPCGFCFQERRSYYYCLLFAIASDFSIQNRRLYWLTSLLLTSILLIMIYNTCLSIIHVGFEWNIWKADTLCHSKSMQFQETDSITNTTDLLNNINKKSNSPCSQAKLYILGYSLAFWNIVLSIILSVMSCVAIIRTLRESSSR